jgi:ParB-like nuclease domain
MSATSRLPIDEIIIGNRHRHDKGDVASLASSIKEIGLLHPIVVRSDHTLIAGERRMSACRELGWTDVPVTVINIDEIVRGELAENAERINTVPRESILTNSKGIELILLQKPKAAPAPVPEVPTFIPDAALSADAQAAQVLLHVLPESGQTVPATAVKEAAKRYGIARRALKKAQLALSIRPKKTPTGWTWALPKGETA